jgi:hypothetical protein
MEKQLYAVYKVGFLTIAIGPIHHTIDLINARTGKPCGKLDCNIMLTQVEHASIELMDCVVTILD